VAVARVWRISPAEVLALDMDMVGRMVDQIEREARRRGRKR